MNLCSLSEEGVIVDIREPDVMRVAPAPLYNSFEDVFHFIALLKEFVASGGVSRL